jgi:hypothetical protein
MAVDWCQVWSWGPITNPGDRQNNYFRIPFADAPHIVGSAYLNEVSIGDRDGTAGVAVATFKRFEFLDDNGLVQVTDLTSVSAFIEVQRCVSITIAFDLIDATACAGWSFYWLS